MTLRALLLPAALAFAMACSPAPEDVLDDEQEQDAGPSDAGHEHQNDAGPDDQNDAGPDDHLIDEEGGTVAADGVTLVIPPGALSEPVAITIEKTTVAAPEGVKAVSSYYLFEPAGTQFALPVTVTFTTASSQAQARVYWSNDADGFDPLDSTIDGHMVTAEVTHFSVGFVGVASDTPPAGECDDLQTLTRSMLDTFEPIGSLAPNSGPARIVVAGGATFIQYGGGHLTNGARPYGADTYVSLDGRSFELWNQPLFSSAESAGTLVDPATGELFAFSLDGTDLAVLRQSPGGCSERVGTIAGSYLGGSAPLAFMPDGRIFGVVQKRSPAQMRVAVFSDDRGATWVEAGEIGGTMAAVAPSDPARIHVGTGYNAGSLGSVATSTDEGATWTRVKVPSDTNHTGNSTVQSIVVDPANPSVVYALTVGTSAPGLYKSTDAGASFPQAHKIDAPGAVNTLAVSPSGQLWIATDAGLFRRGADDTEWTGFNEGIPQEELGTWAVGFNGAGIWRLDSQLRKSSDGGATWTVMPVAGFASLTSKANLSDPTDENVLYAESVLRTDQLYRSTNGGRSFELVEMPRPYPQHFVTAVTGQGTLLGFVPNDEGGIGVRSTDRGTTWSAMQGLALHSDWAFGDDEGGVHTHRSGPNAYVLDDAMNLYRTTDDGATWTFVRKLGVEKDGVTHGVAILVDPATSGRFYIRDLVDGVSRMRVTSDAGDTETVIEGPPDTEWTDAQVDWDGRLWVRVFDQGVMKLLTVEPGATTLTDRTPPVFGMTTVVVRGDRVIAGSMLTTDGGLTWTALDQVSAYVEANLPIVFHHRANVARTYVNIGALRSGLWP